MSRFHCASPCEVMPRPGIRCGGRKVVRPSAMETIIDWSEFASANSMEGVGRPGFGSAAEW